MKEDLEALRQLLGWVRQDRERPSIEHAQHNAGQVLLIEQSRWDLISSSRNGCQTKRFWCVPA